MNTFNLLSIVPNLVFKWILSLQYIFQTFELNFIERNELNSANRIVSNVVSMRKQAENKFNGNPII